MEERWVLLSVRWSIALELANVLFRVASEDVDDVGRRLQLEGLLDLHWQRRGRLLILRWVSTACCECG